MSRLHDMFTQWAATWAIFSISNTGQELPDIEHQIKVLMKKIYQEAMDERAHTGISLESAFNHLVDEL